MTERQSFEINELKIKIMKSSEYTCQVCGKITSRGQLAHRIKKSKYNLKKYGKEIIHHYLNLVYVCDLYCNSKVDIGCNEELEKKIVNEIKEILKGG
jgi:hypothetical protein